MISPQEPPRGEAMLTPKQTAARLRVSSSTVIRLVDAGQFPGAVNVGLGQLRRRGLKIPETDVETYLSKSLIAPTSEAA